MKLIYLSAVCLAFLPVNCSVLSAESDLELDAAYTVGKITNPQLKEISGMVVSRANDNIIWVHNDSGSNAEIFAVDFKGNQKGVFTLEGVKARDWEDIATGPGPQENSSYLYVGDIGDNFGQWPFVSVYRFPEPKISPGQDVVHETIRDFDTIKLIFEDGPRDAEALMVDPVTKDIIIITKREEYSRVYHCPWPYTPEKINKLIYCCDLPWRNTTAGDISIDGQLIILRSYIFVTYWKRIDGRPLWEVFKEEPYIGNLVFERQGESVALDTAGGGYFTISEGLEQNLHYFKFPEKPIKPSDREEK